MEVLASGGRVPLGDVYAFISSLYFRGKRAYAGAFGRAPEGTPTTWVVTPGRGMLPVDEPVGLDALRAFAGTAVDPEEPAYVDALVRAAADLAAGPAREGTVVLLGSIASERYLEPLANVLGRRLLFPSAFIGRGDMSRGGLMLRAVEAREELEYVVALDAERRGSRPPRLS